MSLQLLRGREAKLPLRSVRPTSGPQLKDATPAVPGKKAALRFPVGPETREFYKTFYPGTSTVEWNDWRWQMRARIRTLDDLSRIFNLSADETDAVGRH